jgi:hypothetical protein
MSCLQEVKALVGHVPGYGSELSSPLVGDCNAAQIAGASEELHRSSYVPKLTLEVAFVVVDGALVFHVIAMEQNLADALQALTHFLT